MSNWQRWRARVHINYPKSYSAFRTSYANSLTPPLDVVFTNRLLPWNKNLVKTQDFGSDFLSRRNSLVLTVFSSAVHPVHDFFPLQNTRETRVFLTGAAATCIVPTNWGSSQTDDTCLELFIVADHDRISKSTPPSPISDLPYLWVTRSFMYFSNFQCIYYQTRRSMQFCMI